MSDFKGYIARCYEIWCGRCVVWYRLESTTASSATAEARKLGWKLTKKDGWVCPDCNKEEG